MEKLVYVLWRPTDRSPDAFRDDLLDLANDALVRLGAPHLTLQVADGEAEAGASARISRLPSPPAATVSFWLESPELRGPYEAALQGVAERAAVYEVAESVPLAAVEPVGKRSSGLSMVSFLTPLPGLPQAEFLELWHDEHRGVALDLQSTHLYVRDTVARALSPDAPPWAGIVAEGFADGVLSDPMRWYSASSPEELRDRQRRMLESVRAFLDLSQIEVHPMSRWRLAD